MYKVLMNILNCQIWAQPLAAPEKPSNKTPKTAAWQEYARTAWTCNPSLAMNLIDRCAAIPPGIVIKIAANKLTPYIIGGRFIRDKPSSHAIKHHAS